VEDGRLEAKSAPYQIGQEHQKLELAKDVAALANANGGVLLIGVRTERDPVHLADEITAISPFAQNLLDSQQYFNILASWIYPSVDGVDIRWYPSRPDATQGIVFIMVPEQSEANRLFLLTRSVESSGRISEVLFGYSERQRANAVPWTVQELQSILRDGRNRGAIQRQLEGIQQQLELLRADRVAEPIQRPSHSLDARMAAARDIVGFTNVPTFLLAAVPDEPLNLPGSFDRQSELARLVEHPPELRPMGFDLETGGTPEIVRGEVRRAFLREFRLLELWRDGTLVFVGRGDEQGLWWASNGTPRINPLVLAEWTFLFARLTHRVYELAAPPPTTVEYRLKITYLHRDGAVARLAAGGLRGHDFEWRMNEKPAPESECVVARAFSRAVGAPEIAYFLVKNVYHWFGFTSDDVPYVERLPDGERGITETQLLAAAPRR
jgi:schlafen family protein